MYHVYAAEDLHRHRAAEVAREVELMRRIAERPAEPSRPSPSIVARVTARLRTVFVHAPHPGRPVLGG